MKKRILAFLTIIFALTIVMPFAALAYNAPVTDEVGYLTHEEINELNSYLDEVRREYDMDVVVYIEERAPTDNMLLRASDIYDDLGYGIGKNHDGIMMYISKYPRKYTFSTCGNGIHIFNSKAIDRLTDATMPYLRADDYYGAIKAYADATRSILKMTADGQPYGSEEDGYSTLLMWGLVVIVPLVVAAFATHIRGKSMNTAVYNNYADSYMRGGVNLTTTNDLFLYSTITRTPRVKNTTSTGGSRTHTSSSGRVHGGGGGGRY